MAPGRTTAMLVALLLAGAAPRVLAVVVPPWVQAQLTATLPEHDAKTPAVVLYSETTLTIEPTGKLLRVQRQVIKILRPEGSGYGVIRADSSAQIRIIGMHGWNIPAGGQPTDVSDRDAVESAVIGVPQGSLVGDVRSRLLRIPGVLPGNIIAGEITQELQPFLLADDWVFQTVIPVRESHFSLELQSGWSYKAHWINHADAAPASSGIRSVWTLTDLKPIRVEPYMPPWQAISGRLALSLVPPSGHGQGFESWSDIGAWYLNLAQSRRVSSAEIKQQVAALTAAQPTLLAKIQALANFVQTDVRYVAIELGIGGWQPHAAADVFAHRYGDCKDKATLLATMLQEIGVEASYVIVNSRRGAITESTPPNIGFDHVILAIQLPAGVDGPGLLALATHPKLGRILFFDPTDTYTPLGGLAGPLQAGFGLLISAEGSEIVQLPTLPVTASSQQRTAHLTLDASGTLQGEVNEVSTGDMAAFARSAVDTTTQDTAHIKPLETVMAQSFATFTVTNAVIRNQRAHELPLEWNYNIEVPRFAEASGDLLTLRPRVLGSQTTAFLETKEARENDIEFEGPRKDTDVFEITLPQGFVVDDMPQPLDVVYPYAAYHSKTEVAGRTLRYTRSLEIRQVTVPVAQAANLKQFFRTIFNDEGAVVVLRRTTGN
jgi:Transglutaminase-like superfamily/Domain of Unknown Function with PDB structure (DUF3857)